MDGSGGSRIYQEREVCALRKVHVITRAVLPFELLQGQYGHIDRLHMLSVSSPNNVGDPITVAGDLLMSGLPWIELNEDILNTTLELMAQRGRNHSHNGGNRKRGISSCASSGNST